MQDIESESGNSNDGTVSRPSADGTGDRLYTKADVESIVQGRIKESKADKEKTAATIAAKEREAADATMRASFMRDVAKRGMDIDLADDLFESYRAKPSDDRTAWLDKMSAVLRGTGSASTTQPKPPATESAKAAVSTSDKGSPTTAPADFDSLSNPNDMTPAHWEREVSRHGLAEAQRRLQASVNRWLSGVRIKLT
jgi:hypothetical protein